MHLTVHEEKRYKMYIVKKKNTYIHWWGKIIVLISNDEYYKLNDLETYLVQKIMRNNNSINVINSISNELEVDTCEAEEFVSIFLNNYDSIFEYKKQNKAMNISGEKGKYFPVAQMTLFIHNIDEAEENYIKKYHINYDYIKTIDHKILQAIVDEKIFIRHIPENELKRNQITPQSFVIVSSAFEWEFKQLFPNGVEHTKTKINKMEEIKNDLLQLSVNYDKQKNKVIKKIVEDVGRDNLESKIIYTNKKLSNISEIFLQYLCNLNYIKNKNKIFTNLQKLRNDFAHGNMDIDIDSDGFVGIIYLERLIYIMQLKRFGLDDENIKKAINKLFGGNIAL